jgi:hypothetical protein
MPDMGASFGFFADPDRQRGVRIPCSDLQTGLFRSLVPPLAFFDLGFRGLCFSAFDAT